MLINQIKLFDKFKLCSKFLILNRSHNLLHIFNRSKNLLLHFSRRLPFYVIAVWNRFRCRFSNACDLGFEIRAFLVHRLEYFHPFANDFQMAVLFEGLFGSAEDQVYLAFIVSNILHWCKLLLQVLQVIIERFCLVANRVDVSCVCGHWRYGIRAALARNGLRIISRTVEVFDVLLKLVHHIVHILEFIEWIPWSNNLLTPI